MAPLPATSLQRHPGLKLFVGSGAYDLCTPSGSARHMLTRGTFLAERMTNRVYESAHMPCLGDALPTLADDLRDFVRSA